MASFVVSSAVARGPNASVSPIIMDTLLCSNYCTATHISAPKNKETSSL